MQDKREIGRKAGEFLMQLGIYPNRNGFKYLKTLAILGLTPGEGIYPITKTGYDKVAKMYNITPKSVMLTIRSTIKLGMSRTPHSVWAELIGEGKTIPSNANFIRIMIKEVRESLSR